MATNYIRALLGATLLSLLLAACDKAPPPEAPAASPPAPVEAPAPPADDMPAPASEVPPANAAEPAPSPPPTPPPPTEPSAVPKPTSTEPALESMPVATASAKISVPVSLRYQIDGEALSGQPFTLHLAAIPRVAGARLQVSVKDAPGLQTASGSLASPEGERGDALSAEAFGDTFGVGTGEPARAHHHGPGRGHRIWIFHHPACERYHGTKAGFGKTTLSFRLRGRVNYAP